MRDRDSCVPGFSHCVSARLRPVYRFHRRYYYNFTNNLLHGKGGRGFQLRMFRSNL